MVLAPEAGLSEHGGAKVEGVFVDHRGDPAQGRAEAEKLIQNQNVSFIIGAIFSSVTKVVSQVAARQKVPMATTSTDPGLTERGIEWLWRPTPHDGQFTANQFDFVSALEDPPVETCALVHEDSDYGSSAADEQRKLAEEYNIEVLEEISYTASELTSFTSQTDVLKQADPDVLFQTSYIQDGLTIIETFRDRDYTPPITMGGGDLAGPTFYNEHPELAQHYTLRTTYADELREQIPVLQPFGDLMKEQADVQIGGVPARISNLFLTAVAGLNQAGSTDSGAIQESMNNLELTGNQIGAPYDVKFDDTGQNELANGVVVQIKDSSPRLVWPFDVAEDGVLTYPVPSWSER
jgi:branched-chain amino acid transport system substrate-binding protein